MDGRRRQDLVRKWSKRSVWHPLPASIPVREQASPNKVQLATQRAHSPPASHCRMSKKGFIDPQHSWGLSEDRQVHVPSPYSDYPCHSLAGGFPTHPAALFPQCPPAFPPPSQGATGQLLKPFPITDPNTEGHLHSYFLHSTEANCTEPPQVIVSPILRQGCSQTITMLG